VDLVNACNTAILEDTGTTLPGLIADVPTVAEFEARTLPAADYTIVSDLPAAAPTAVQVRQEMDANSTKLANLDATVSSRLAAASYSAAPSTAAIDAALSASHGAGLWGGAGGSGATESTYTVTNSVDGLPIADVAVWVTTDAPGTNRVASGVTDAFGVVTFWLDSGTYYLWREKSGWTFANPDTEVVA
jgi:cell division septation protein DedD